MPRPRVAVQYLLPVLLLCALVVGFVVAASARRSIDQLMVGIKKRAATCSEATTARVGDKLSIHYEGRLLDGTVFDSSVTRGQPFEFTLGRGMVIQGWDQGVEGMCVGEKRKLQIPHALAYGDRAMGASIPPKSDLIFDVELLGLSRDNE